MKKTLLLSLLGLLATFNAFALKGDVNGDGAVTATDVTALYNYLLNGDETFLSTSDVDGDGYITSADVTVVYNIMLNGSEPEVTEYTVNGVTFKMVKVDGGTFNMGGTNNPDESPVHQVTLSTFNIGQTEVTQELWDAVMGSNPSQHVGSNLPVEYVSWNECQEFITKLNAMTGRNFRLPTEAEWEYAARGGANSQGYNYSGSNTLDDVAWYYGNSDNTPHEVATKAPNELGIYDMSGNAWEWCLDWYGDYSASAQTNPLGPDTGTERILRGGGCQHDTWAFPLTFRNALPPASHDPSVVGLRLVEGPIAKKVFSVNGVIFNMIKVDGGTFMMGAADDDTEAYDLERPAHQVTLSGYWIGETEVTEALWKAVMEVDETSYSMGDNYPVRRVSWDDCIEFAERLSQLTGVNFTLPTEAQWEFAARGGNLSHGYLYAGSNALGDVAWYADNSGDVLHEVATKAPNELGIYDMCGNIAEWCLDDIYNYTPEAQVDPTHPKTTVNNMLRSSAWDDVAKDSRLTTRWKTNGSSKWIGFRLAIQN